MRNDLPLSVAEILLPKNANLTKWAVVACDQFSSNPKYWKDLETQIGDSPSSLNLILPECYLGTPEEVTRAKAISQNMTNYLSSGFFKEYNGYILCKRTTAYGNCRTGLVMQIDLNAYDYHKGTKPLIRATEGTVIERIPPRVKIRQDCCLELPHVMLLINDPNNTVIKAAKGSAHTPIYDFDLNMNGGHISGSLIQNGFNIESALNDILEKSIEDYGEPFLMAVGDGNHSLAAAKETYEQALKADSRDAMRLRYALVEVVNIYDEGLKFEPIHRVMFDVSPANFVKKLQEKANSMQFDSVTQLYIGDKTESVKMPCSAIEGVKFIQNFIDEYIKENGGKVDYIHGYTELKNLAKTENAVGIELKSMNKAELFDYIIKNDVLPRKTFSMGEAEEKRYYLEAHRIR